jgi:hypothetical protein
MHDFTLKTYKPLLQSMHQQAFSFLPFSEFLHSPKKNTICLRHDVDLLSFNSLEFARIQHAMRIRGTYYFRAVAESWNEDVIREIDELGHEVGYHYESLSTAKGDMKLAIADFERNLENLRRLVPVNTICMHGSPRSRWDSRDLWKKYKYRDYGIIGEPYFDLDFSKTAYYTDTGRRWDGEKFSIRDKTDQACSQPVFRSTHQMIRAIEAGTFPKRAILTFHPQRWTNQPLPWLKELVWQNSKNIVKYFLIQTAKK